MPSQAPQVTQYGSMPSPSASSSSAAWNAAATVASFAAAASRAYGRLACSSRRTPATSARSVSSRAAAAHAAVTAGPFATSR